MKHSQIPYDELHASSESYEPVTSKNSTQTSSLPHRVAFILRARAGGAGRRGAR
jgi:hypothetical protein